MKHRWLALLLILALLEVRGDPPYSSTTMADSTSYLELRSLLTQAKRLSSDSSSLEGKRAALTVYEQALAKARQSHDTLGIGMAHLGAAYIYLDFQIYEEALIQSLHAINAFEAARDTPNLILCFISAGTAFRETGEYDQAMGFAVRGHEMARNSNNEALMAPLLSHIGEGHFWKKEYEVALQYYQESCTLAQATLDDSHCIYPLGRMGACYLQLGRWEEAGDAYSRAIALGEKYHDLLNLATAHAGLAALYQEAKEWNKALVELDRSSDYCQKAKLPRQQLENLEAYAHIYASLNSPKQYLYFTEQSQALRDSLDHIGHQDALLRLNLLFESNLKDDQIQRYRLEAALKEEALRVRNLQVRFAIAISLLLMGLAIALFYLYRLYRKNNELLGRELKELNDELETVAYRTAHDIRGPVARMLGLLGIAQDVPHSDEMDDYLLMLRREGVQMDLMLHRFLDIHNVKHMAHESETVNLRFEIDEILNSMHNLENYPRIHFRIEVPGDLSITAGKHLVRIMLRNIIENAVVFARKDWKIVPRIRIRAIKDGETVRMNITDNGIGIAQEVAPHIFNMFYRGTTTSSGLGLGLYAASVAAGLIGAHLRLVKDNTSETEFEISLPLRPVRPLQHITHPVSA